MLAERHTEIDGIRALLKSGRSAFLSIPAVPLSPNPGRPGYKSTISETVIRSDGSLNTATPRNRRSRWSRWITEYLAGFSLNISLMCGRKLATVLFQ